VASTRSSSSIRAAALMDEPPLISSLQVCSLKYCTSHLSCASHMPHTHLILFSMFTLTLTAWAHLLSLSLPHPSGTDIPYAPDVFDTEAYTFHF
jgi:hypothetical protein